MNIPQKENTIWKLLIDAGYPTYVVGGAVRDSLFGVDCNDIDLATKATPKQIEKVFKGSEFKLDYVGASFGVMLVGGVEVATFRGDRYSSDSKGFHDVYIDYLDTIEEDLARRDITINAMAIDIDGNLIDPYGGVSDINEGIIKFVGDPNNRIKEDPNRILRLLRFASRFNFKIDFDSWNSTVEYVENNKLDSIAPERIQMELIKVMKTVKNASVFWNHALFSGILSNIFPELCDGWNHDHGNHHTESIWDHNMIAGDTISTEYPLLKLATYLHDVGKPASFDKDLGTFYEHQHFGADIVRERLADLKFSNDDIRFVVNSVLVHMDGTRGMSNKSRRKIKNKLNAYGIEWREYVRLRMGDRAGNVARSNFTISEVKDYVNMFTIDEEVPFSVNDLKLSGGDIIRIFSLTPSPLVGIIQRELLKRVIDDGDETNHPETLVEIVVDVFGDQEGIVADWSLIYEE